MIKNIINFILDYSSPNEKIKIILVFCLSVINIFLQLSLIIIVYLLISKFINLSEDNLSFGYFSQIIYNLDEKRFFILAFTILFLNIIINSIFIHQSFKRFSIFTRNIEQIIFKKFVYKKYEFYKKAKSYEIVKIVIDNLPRITLGKFYPLLICLLIDNFLNYYSIIFSKFCLYHNSEYWIDFLGSITFFAVKI